MLDRSTGRLGTGRIDQAAIRAAQEAAKKAAEEAAKRAAEAAAKRAAEEAAKRTAAAAEREAASPNRTSKFSLGELGKLPWEHVSPAAADAVGLVTGAGGYVLLKNSLSVQKKVEDIRKTVNTVSTAVQTARQTGESALAKLSETRPPSVKPLDALGRVNSAVKMFGGLQSATRLQQDFKNLTDGEITMRDATSAAKDVLGTVRGADEAVKFFQGTTKGVLGKMAPGIGIAASVADAAHRIDQLSKWNELSTKDKVANVAYLVGDAADVVGNFFPPAKAVGAGMALVGMGAENWDTLKEWGSTAGDVAGTAGRFVGQTASRAADAVADTAKEVVGDVKEAASKVTSTISNGLKSVFGW